MITIENSHRVDLNIKDYLDTFTIDEICEIIKKINWDQYFNIWAFCYPVQCMFVKQKDKGLAWANKNIIEVTFPFQSQIGFDDWDQLEKAIDIIEETIVYEKYRRNI